MNRRQERTSTGIYEASFSLNLLVTEGNSPLKRIPSDEKDTVVRTEDTAAANYGTSYRQEVSRGSTRDLSFHHTYGSMPGNATPGLHFSSWRSAKKPGYGLCNKKINARSDRFGAKKGFSILQGRSQDLGLPWENRDLSV
jgi:hypothetical protein